MRRHEPALAPLVFLPLIASGCLTGRGPAGDAGVRAERDKGSVQAQLAAGKEYLAAEQWNDAFIVFRRAALLDGSNYDAQLGLAQACARLGETKVGLDAAEAATEARPQEPAPLLAAGRICLSARKLDEAQKYLKEALALDGSLADAWRDIGEARLLDGSVGASVAALEKARSLKPDDADIRGKLGAVYAADGQYGKAIPEYRKAVELDPENAVYCKNLAWLLIEENESLGEAEKLARKSDELEWADGDALVAVAAALIYQGRADEAIGELRGALNRSETNGDLYIYFAMASAARGVPGDHENAYKALQYVRAMGLPYRRVSQEQIDDLIDDIEAELTQYIEAES